VKVGCKDRCHIHDNFGNTDGLRWSVRSRFDRNLFKSIEYIFTAYKFAEDGMFLVEMGSSFECKIELRSERPASEEVASMTKSLTRSCSHPC